MSSLSIWYVASVCRQADRQQEQVLPVTLFFCIGLCRPQLYVALNSSTAEAWNLQSDRAHETKGKGLDVYELSFSWIIHHLPVPSSACWVQSYTILFFHYFFIFLFASVWFKVCLRLLEWRLHGRMLFLVRFSSLRQEAEVISRLQKTSSCYYYNIVCSSWLWDRVLDKNRRHK